MKQEVCGPRRHPPCHPSCLLKIILDLISHCKGSKCDLIDNLDNNVEQSCILPPCYCPRSSWAQQAGGVTFPILWLTCHMDGWILKTPYHYWTSTRELCIFDVSQPLRRTKKPFLRGKRSSLCILKHSKKLSGGQVKRNNPRVNNQGRSMRL